MNRLLARLELVLGRFAIERLAVVIVGATAVVWVLGLMKPAMLPLLTLDPALAPRQPWRFVTYLFMPETDSPIWLFFALYFTWLLGSALEAEWGAFKFNVYYLLGAVGTTVAAFVTREPHGNFWLNSSLFFAFATLFPNYQLYVLFVIPVRVKWLALLAFAGVGLRFFQGDLGAKAAIAVALGNYFLFFGGHLVQLARGRRTMVRQAARLSSMRPSAPPPRTGRVCAICGKSQDDGADIRVCSCEKCGSPRELCLEHARHH